MGKDSPYYHLVPKEPQENLRFRRDMLRLAREKPENARELWIMCSRDELFYVNTFVWTYDPRLVEPVVPFITYEFQDETLLEMDGSIRVGTDIAVQKSRDMGASWMCLIAYEYRWHFRHRQSFLLVSRVEDLVDKKDEPDALMWKIDFIHEHQPSWLIPPKNRQKLSLINLENGSTITGASTTSETARGGRKTSILLDEFAAVPDGHAMLNATQHATNCRIFNSTPQGSANAFYEVVHKTAGVKVLTLHWPRHPVKATGLYHDQNGKPRSPWYDLQCQRAPHPVQIAQELDLDYMGSDYQFFDPIILDRHRKEYACAPYMVGDLDYDTQTLTPVGFHRLPKGRFQLWTHVDGQGDPPRDRTYCLGVDVSQGTGSSNSVISILDRKTQEIVGEWVDPHTRPEDLARIAVAIGRWLRGDDDYDAYLIWEANGPGRAFGSVVIELGYRNIYYRQQERSISKKVTDNPGWYATRDTQVDLFTEYRRAMAAEEIIIRSREQLHECGSYVFMQTGFIEHAPSMNTIDPSGARANHGDRVTAAALAWKARAMFAPEPKQTEPEVLPGSFLNRRLESEQREQAEAEAIFQGDPSWQR